MNSSPLVFFDATLFPHRSLPKLGFHLLMAGLFAISLGVGIGFVLLGAWPVCGFFGLDVAALYLAFRLSYRSARQSENLRLTAAALDIERISVRGERKSWRFQPFWLRLILEEWGEDGENRLVVTSHGNTVALATFLAPGERRRLAWRLQAALARCRAGEETAAS